MSQDLAVSSDRDRTLELSTFLSNLKYSDLPPEVIHMAKASILNSIGCGLSSAFLEPSKKLFAALDVTDKEPRPCTVIGRPERASIDDAAMLNGLFMTARFYDDTHLATVVHPSGTPLAAILPYAEANNSTGKEVIVAFVVGVEMQLAVASALGLGPYRKGWHLTSVTGTFGATAAIAKLMNLSPEDFAAALGHASSMASGSRGVFATDTLVMHAGRGAQNGILAARLARASFGSTTHALEKWVRLMSSGESDMSLISTLSEARSEKERRWMIMDNTFKPYPCGIVIHPVIDAGVEAHRYFFENPDSPVRHKSPQDVLEIFQHIEASVTPLTVRLCGVTHPIDFMQVIFSTYHGLAVGLVYGKAGIREFSEAAARDPLIIALRDKISLKTDESLEDDQAYVRFSYTSKTGGNKIKEFRIQHATGSLANPMTDEQLESKFAEQATEGKLTQNKINQAVKSCWDLDRADDLAGLLKTLVPE